ncbi:hypothetical protein H0H81_010444 [Sphagnurus paluster]|uniref:Uncharacterized protein n=1 Tax=Sphagnurus paluster TaxID=117069 RepID=A0A9P7K3R5_9AGAR|nr:hypothetical protein H0H81_010444 [Sphagnurus paluster]
MYRIPPPNLHSPPSSPTSHAQRALPRRARAPIEIMAIDPRPRPLPPLPPRPAGNTHHPPKGAARFIPGPLIRTLVLHFTHTPAVPALLFTLLGKERKRALPEWLAPCLLIVHLVYSTYRLVLYQAPLAAAPVGHPPRAQAAAPNPARANANVRRKGIVNESDDSAFARTAALVRAFFDADTQRVILFWALLVRDLVLVEAAIRAGEWFLGFRKRGILREPRVVRGRARARGAAVGLRDRRVRL